MQWNAFLLPPPPPSLLSRAAAAAVATNFTVAQCLIDPSDARVMFHIQQPNAGDLDMCGEHAREMYKFLTTIYVHCATKPVVWWLARAVSTFTTVFSSSLLRKSEMESLALLDVRVETSLAAAAAEPAVREDK